MLLRKSIRLNTPHMLMFSSALLGATAAGGQTLEEVKDFLLAYLKSGGIAMMKTFLSTQIKEMMKGGPSGLKDKIAGGTLF
jgi:hypothetical protein